MIRLFCRAAGRLALVLTLALGALPALAEMGRLTGVLPEDGTDSPWSYRSGGGQFEMTNATEPNALQYFYVNPEPGREGTRTVSVDVALAEGSDGLAGLLYGFDPETRHYHLLVVESAGRVSLFRRDAVGFSPVAQTETDALRPGSNTLAIAEAGRLIRLSINGRELLELGNDSLGRGALGIAAAGVVQARFANFVIQ